MCRIPSVTHGIVSKSVCRGGLERSMSLFCAAIHGMRGKSVCREGLSDEMPPSRRAIQGNSCKSVCRAAKCAVSVPFLPATHGIVSKSVCRRWYGPWHVPFSVLRYTVCEVKVCVAEGEDMPGIVGLRSRRDKQLHLCGSIFIQCEASRNSFFGQRVFDIQHLGYEKKLFM